MKHVISVSSADLQHMTASQLEAAIYRHQLVVKTATEQLAYLLNEQVNRRPQYTRPQAALF